MCKSIFRTEAEIKELVSQLIGRTPQSVKRVRLDITEGTPNVNPDGAVDLCYFGDISYSYTVHETNYGGFRIYMKFSGAPVDVFSENGKTVVGYTGPESCADEKTDILFDRIEKIENETGTFKGYFVGWRITF